MSYFHYIASNYALKTGNFGYEQVIIKSLKRNSPTSVIVNNKGEYKLGVMKDKSLEWLKDNMIVFDTEYGGSGVFVSERLQETSSIDQHFSNTHIYEISPNWGQLVYHENQNRISKKCVDFLVKYIRDELTAGFTFEFLTTWADEESLNLNEIIIIDISDEDQIKNIKIRESQLIRFT